MLLMVMPFLRVLSIHSHSRHLVISLSTFLRRAAFGAARRIGAFGVGLFQFLGKAEGEFDAGDEAGEFVFTAEGTDGVENGVHIV